MLQGGHVSPAPGLLQGATPYRKRRVCHHSPFPNLLFRGPSFRPLPYVIVAPARKRTARSKIFHAFSRRPRELVRQRRTLVVEVAASRLPSSNSLCQARSRLALSGVVEPVRVIIVQLLHRVLDHGVELLSLLMIGHPRIFQSPLVGPARIGSEFVLEVERVLTGVVGAVALAQGIGEVVVVVLRDGGRDVSERKIATQKAGDPDGLP